jgi:hypothetical protein
MTDNLKSEFQRNLTIGSDTKETDISDHGLRILRFEGKSFIQWEMPSDPLVDQLYIIQNESIGEKNKSDIYNYNKIVEKIKEHARSSSKPYITQRYRLEYGTDNDHISQDMPIPRAYTIKRLFEEGIIINTSFEKCCEGGPCRCIFDGYINIFIKW